MLNMSPKLHAYTPIPSNGSSIRVLRCLFSRRVSCLDAFSTYPLTRSCPALPCRTTGRPVASVPRSSRTRRSFHSDTKTFPVDIKQTASQRSEPSSRSLLMGEHPHPWLLLHSQDRKSRHRCSKPRRRFELSGATTLLSPE